MTDSDKIRIIFVCLGNICRSPLGEGIFRSMVEERGLSERFHIDSAGTANYHVGELPDPGSRQIALKHGISLDDQRGRQFTAADLATWDYIIAMDASNKESINKLGRAGGNVHLLREFDPQGPGDVPDPWSQGEEAFLQTYTIIHRSSASLLNTIISVHHLE